MSIAGKQEKQINVRKQLGYIMRNGGGIVLAFIVMFIIMTFASPYFLTQNNLVSLLKSAVSTALLAYAMTFTLIAGEIDLSVSSMFAFGAMTCCWFMEGGMSFYISMGLALILCMILGCFNGVVVSCTRVPAFIVTLATQMSIRGIVYLISGGQPITSRNETFETLGSGKVWIFTYPIIILIIITIILAVLLRSTIYGRKIYACGGNREAALFSGINTRVTVLSVFVLSALIAGLAGILSASRLAQAQPVAGDGYEADAIAAAVLGGTSFTGGRGSIQGTIVGAMVLVLLQNGMNLLGVNYYWQLVIQGLLIIIAVYMDVTGRKE